MVANLMKYFLSIALSFLSVVSIAARGQALSDPTRPPAGFYDAAPASGRAAYAPVKGLQSVIISPSHCAAIINGKTIVLGARYGSEKLVEISERGVVLQGAQGRRVLTMFPGVAVKITETPVSQKPAGKCMLEPMTHTKNPPLQDGQKEMK
ncbi:MAG: hypothetical protein WC236_01320 [Gallionellaceae bacterium]|jgi:hypothetical protein